MGSAVNKYQKYYSFIDESNTYYAAAILDPRVKTKLIEYELPKGDAKMLIQALKEELSSQYTQSSIELEPSILLQQDLSEPLSLESRMLSKLQPQKQQSFISDIDRYFDTPPIQIPETFTKDKKHWLLSW